MKVMQKSKNAKSYIKEYIIETINSDDMNQEQFDRKHHEACNNQIKEFKEKYLEYQEWFRHKYNDQIPLDAEFYLWLEEDKRNR